MSPINRKTVEHYYRAVHLHQKKKICAALLALMLMIIYQQNPGGREMWVDHWVARRQLQGAHLNLFLELRNEKPEKYKRCMRMTPEMFDWLLEKVRPYIGKQDTHLRKSISAAERLSITLRHLATGEKQESLSLLYRVGQSTISGIIKEACRAIHLVLKDTYLRFPSSEEEWKNVATEFKDRWNFPNCLGAMDGKRILIQPPLQSGSMYFNYKETFSIVLMAVVDADLRIIYADVGTNGRVSDKGVWNKCALKKGLDTNSLNIPRPSTLPCTQDEYPYIFVGDEGFTLSTKLLIPYPKELLRGRNDRRIFNYRLSRARRCSENVFGIMANRFQILLSPMRYDPDDAKDIVWAILSLHNLLRSDTIGRTLYTPSSLVDRENVLEGRLEPGEWRREPASRGIVPLGHQGGNRHAADSQYVRDKFCYYFNSVGTVPWQDRMIGLGD